MRANYTELHSQYDTARPRSLASTADYVTGRLDMAYLIHSAMQMGCHASPEPFTHSTYKRPHSRNILTLRPRHQPAVVTRLLCVSPTSEDLLFTPAPLTAHSGLLPTPTTTTLQGNFYCNFSNNPHLKYVSTHQRRLTREGARGAEAGVEQVPKPSHSQHHRPNTRDVDRHAASHLDRPQYSDDDVLGQRMLEGGGRRGKLQFRMLRSLVSELTIH